MRRLWTVAAAALTIGLGTVPVADAAGRDATVRTDAGWVRGSAEPGHVAYRGIPYAAPPVGDLRWRSPRAVAPWPGVRDATRPGSRCPQAGLTPSVDEDCLYLNVTAPRGARRAPVLVWIHGGGLIAGAGSDYDARRLATQGGLVVVTVNYRLGNLGFFGHPGVADGGAFGIEDQQAALRWVRRNVSAFGGDPGNVTVAGESAGSHSVCAHLASPAAAGLFQRAIGQSTACPGGLFDGSPVRPLLDVPYFVPPAWHDAHGVDVATAVGCSSLDCLRAAPVAALLAAPALPLPGYGNAVLPSDPVEAFASGRHTRVPFLTGLTRDEGTLFAPLVVPDVTQENYAEKLNVHFGVNGPAIAARYPLSGSALQAVASIMSDLDWALPQHDAEARFASRMPTYAYEFLDRTAPAIPEYPPGAEPLASHGSELAYLFDMPSTELTPRQARLGDRMVRYWSRFARTGDPNGTGLPPWPRVTASRHHVQGLDLGPRGIGPFDRTTAHQLDFWRSLVG